ncbi:serum response factor-binding protein 1 [Copidosoma floridanum]|uniref:serum response factor-binding protein 1 n=1 Tax=Copidosoma floridanum TaxID=29053 RepID=UPI0006C9C3F7|nr:serum response factor-binding protein 1 [Copidosoma floridanum]
MSKPEINNQIVLMRKDALQARVHVIKKLSRDAQKLRSKKGTEAEKAKNLRKADRIAAEILAAKKVQKDEFTIFALTNSMTLEEILTDQKSEPLTKFKARIAYNKKFQQKIAGFKEKYPNYLEFLKPGKKKKVKLERKQKKELKKSQEVKNSSKKDGKKVKKANEKFIDVPDKSDEEKSISENDTDCEFESDNEVLDTSIAKKACKKKHNNSEVESFESLEIKKPKKSSDKLKTQENIKSAEKLDSFKSKSLKKKQKVDVTKTISKKAISEKYDETEKSDDNSCENQDHEMDSIDSEEEGNKEAHPFFITGNEKKEDVTLNKKSDLAESKKLNKKKKKMMNITKTISKLATVKKFHEMLEEDDINLQENQNDKVEDSSSLKTDVEKEADPFFITENGKSDFLSVAPRQRKIDPEEEKANESSQFNSSASREHFNKFSKFKNNDSKFNSNPKWKNQHTFENNKSDFKWKGQQNNKSRFDSDKPYYNRKNENSHGTDKRVNFNKSNDESQHKQMSRKERRSQKVEVDDTKNLHPSWEAKKKQQDALKLGFQGKKIVFGDD